MAPKALSREIKFRAWDEENKKFIRSSHCIEFDGSVHMYKMGCVIALGDKVELNQWTGLHDKNGKEIYEGDIVKWHDNIENIDKGWSRTAIVNINPDLYFHCFDIGGEEHNHDFHYGNFIWKETDKYFEIIGNIYENQNLLTKENNYESTK